MTYLLDTDTLSNLMKRTPSTALLAKLATVPPREQHTSSITVGELLYGALRAEARSATLLAQIEQRLLPNLIILPLILWPRGAMHLYGQPWSGRGHHWPRPTCASPRLLSPTI